MKINIKCLYVNTGIKRKESYLLVNTSIAHRPFQVKQTEPRVRYIIDTCIKSSV